MEHTSNKQEFRPVRSDSDVSEVSTDMLRMYLNEIGRVPLLTPEQEVELSEIMLAGKIAQYQKDQLEGSGETDIPTLDSLTEVIYKGYEARDQFIKANLRLVVSISKRFSGTMELMDLIQEGNVGLFRAVEKFDHTKGFKFSTYATWWIRQSITRAIADQARTIRIPVHMVERINQYKRSWRELNDKLGHSPNMDELMKATGLSLEQVQQIEGIAEITLSLDQPVGEDEDSVLGDFVADTNIDSDSMIIEIYEKHTREEIEEWLLPMIKNQRERDIVYRRFGLDDGVPHTLEEVGQEFNVTRERIRQIEQKVLNLLRFGLGLMKSPEDRSEKQKGLIEMFGYSPDITRLRLAEKKKKPKPI